MPSRALPTSRARGTTTAPNRAISARWASVSTFCTSVGAPPRPRSNGYGGLSVGFAGRPARRGGALSPRRRRSRRARDATRQPHAVSALGECAAIDERCSSSASQRRRSTTSRAPTAAAAASGAVEDEVRGERSSALSLPLAGSPSAPFTTTTGRPRCCATAASLSAGRKAAAAPPARARSLCDESRSGRPTLGAAPYRARCSLSADRAPSSRSPAREASPRRQAAGATLRIAVDAHPCRHRRAGDDCR